MCTVESKVVTEKEDANTKISWSRGLEIFL